MVDGMVEIPLRVALILVQVNDMGIQVRLLRITTEIGRMEMGALNMEEHVLIMAVPMGAGQTIIVLTTIIGMPIPTIVRQGIAV